MLNKITLLLSMSLNLVLALIVYESNKPVKALDFRDAMSDTHTSGQLMNNSLASLTPAPVAPVDAALVPVTPVVAAPEAVALVSAPVAPVGEVAPVAALAPVKAIAPVKTAALLITSGNDWAAYKQDAAEDTDVFVSNIFRSRIRGEKAAAAAVRRNKALGKNILFSCVLTAKAGGVFYVIRMAPPVIHPPQVAARWKSDNAHSSDLAEITSQAESDIQMMY